MEHDPIFQEERESLRRVQGKYNEIIAESRAMIKRLPSIYMDGTENPNPDMLNEQLTANYNRIVRLERGMDKPHFARIDFTGSETRGSERYYIGKIGVIDADNAVVTLDWRAPVSTLYYDSNVGEVSYSAPGGEVSGTLDLKRQIEIEGGSLISANDVDGVANDELLRPYLGVNADNRLKNIIATIQGEQNRIIREDIGRNLVVQGVAGSGKTTVALHRIAYLVYTYRESIKADQYMVIGPNRFFISYISSVLPDLDVDSVPQYTYADLAREILGEEYKLTEANEKLAMVVAGKQRGEIEGHKVSMAYRDALDRFLADYEDGILPREDFILRGFRVLTAQELKRCWDDAMSGPGVTVRRRVEQCILYAGRLIESRSLATDLQISQFFRERYREDGVDLNGLHRDRTFIEKELATGCAKSLKALFGRTDAKILSLYRQFIEGCENWIDPEFPEAEELKKRTLAGLRSRRIDPEDQPALLYLWERMNGPGRFRSFRHAVIDESQDFGVFDFYVLQRILSGCTFTVVGDVAQSIYRYRGIESWEPVVTGAFGGKAATAEMLKSYRNTVEIMEEANRVTGLLGMNPAEPVIRHGERVGYYSLFGTERAQKMAELIREYEKAGFSSIALLTKTVDEQEELVRQLAFLGVHPAAITGQSSQYEGGLSIMPGYLAKGLEFDAVIICDASEDCYSPAKAVDMHILYVAMTRPLHRLDIFYQKKLTAPLRRCGKVIPPPPAGE
jgi:DNA helicase-2/ATP-dependent DNA helicase PcrA